MFMFPIIENYGSRYTIEQITSLRGPSTYIVVILSESLCDAIGPAS